MFDLRKFAFDHKLQQAALVEVLGIAQSQVSNMMNGIRKVRLEHIAKLRAEYGDIVDKYITSDDAPTPRTATMVPYPTSEAPQGQQLNDVIIPTEDACVIEEGQCVVHCPALPNIQSMFKEREAQMQRMLEAQDKLICEITELNKRLERERERQDKLIERLIDRV